MSVEITFEDSTVIQMRVLSDILLCDFIRQARAEAGTTSRIISVVFL